MKKKSFIRASVVCILIFLITLAIAIISACGPEWEDYEAQGYQTMVDENNDDRTMMDLYGGAYPDSREQETVEVPEGLSPSTPKLERAPGEPLQSYLSGKPVALIHENKYREITPKQIRLNDNFTFALGATDEFFTRYFQNPIPDDKAFRITEIRQTVSFDPGQADVTSLTFDFYIVQDMIPIYHGTKNIKFVPNNNPAGTNAVYFFYDRTVKLDIWIPRQSKLGIVARTRIGDTTIANQAQANRLIILQGYLATPPYPMGKGMNQEIDPNLTLVEWNTIGNTYSTF